MSKKPQKVSVDYNLLKNESGFMELEEGEVATQHSIQHSIDITNATKHFDLKLDKFGPYKLDYSLNGRKLLLGGAKGHMAAFDWQTKKLMCEFNVMEAVQDVKWLHRETMFAVAQKQWTYIYDNNGIELHCLKMLDSVLRLEFLPYHFLLATANSKSYISWLDVSLGKRVAGFTTGLGRLDVMAHNPQNAIVLLGHNAGTVSMWSPNSKTPLVKMMTHMGSVIGLSVTHDGRYMATAGSENKLKIWDLRNYKLLSSSYVPMTHQNNKRSNNPFFSAPIHHLTFSHSNLLAVAFSGGVSVYDGVTSGQKLNLKAPYLSHRVNMPGIGGVSFCPFEDILGVGHSLGFTSLIVPGSGSADYDALEHNPFESKKQQKEAEVKRLLNKIQPDLISLDTKSLSKMEEKSMQEIMKARIAQKFPKSSKRDRSSLGKGGMKGRRGGSGKMGEEHERKFKKQVLKSNEDAEKKEVKKSQNVLQRFKKKKKFWNS